MATKYGAIPNPDAEADDFYTNLRFINQNGCDVSKRLHSDYDRYLEEKFSEMCDTGSFEGYNATSYGALKDDLFNRLLRDNATKYSEMDVKVLEAMYRSSK